MSIYSKSANGTYPIPATVTAEKLLDDMIKIERDIEKERNLKIAQKYIREKFNGLREDELLLAAEEMFPEKFV